MKIIYVAIFAVILVGLGGQEAYAAEKFIINQTVTYQIVKWTNDTHVTNADLEHILDEAILEWEILNPGLKFEETNSDPDIKVNWENISHAGLATCSVECMKTGVIDYIISISIGTENCLGEFTYMTRDLIKNVAMHELGHTLGITHSLEHGNLMFGKMVFDHGVLDSGGFDVYNIPNKYMNWYEGEKEMWFEMFNVRKQLVDLNERISMYDERLDMMKISEVKFQIAFEENRQAINTTLTEMTTATKTQMIVLEDRLDDLQADFNGLNERYERHSELYKWEKRVHAFIDADLVRTENKSNDIIESLICFPLTTEESVMKWVEKHLI